MNIDIHAHIFPYLGEACGFDSIEKHLMYLQRFVASSPAQATRRLKDAAVAGNPNAAVLWDPTNPSPLGAHEVNFRVGKYGRLLWTRDDEDYYLHLYAPNMQSMESSPEFVLAQMDYIGVDKMVLQNAWIYGQLNEYFSAAVKKYPNRFIATVQVNEAKAYEESEISELKRGVREFGLRALYFANARFFENGFQYSYEETVYDPFWEEVRTLQIPVFWDLSAVQMADMPKGMTPFDRFLDQMKRFSHWFNKFPEIPSILVHGVPLRYIREGDKFLSIPNQVWDVWERPNMYVEMLFPMQVSHPVPGGSVWDYPYKALHPLIKEVYQRLGPEKLVWGSDLPNVERNCTYKQSLRYLTDYCNFIPAKHMDLIIGGNAARIFKL